MEYQYNIYRVVDTIRINGEVIGHRCSIDILKHDELTPIEYSYSWDDIISFCRSPFYFEVKCTRKGRVFYMSEYHIKMKQWEKPLNLKETITYEPLSDVSWYELQYCNVDKLIAYCAERGLNPMRA